VTAGRCSSSASFCWAPPATANCSASLPGLATNLLAERLRQLEADGLLERRRAADVAHAAAFYQLTERGAALEPVVLALIRWGAPLMTTGPGGDHIDDRWALLALSAMLTASRVEAPEGDLTVHCGDHEMLVTIDSSGRRVTSEAGATTRPLATVTAQLPDLLAAVSSGTLGPGVAVGGNRQFAAKALRPEDPHERQHRKAHQVP